jgi:sugar phosphate isomerase/epimerase
MSMRSDRVPVIAVSSWSLHRAIGLTWWESPSAPGVQKQAYGPGTIDILDIPAAVARHGITRLQVCHFHVANRDKAWLAEFRAALADAQVMLQTVLIDDGDITDPANHGRDVAWAGGWIDTAAALGAGTARVIAGKQKPSKDALALSVAGLKELALRGKAAGVRVITENWFDLLATPLAVSHVLDAVGDDLGFLADFGNWKGPTKYADLAAIMRRAEDTHAKASFSGPDAMDGADYGKCVAAAMAAGYEGPYTLVYDGPGDDEWAGIEMERQFIRDVYAKAAVDA